jgi:CubicO group peptidase (beta-lactamase class C family)
MMVRKPPIESLGHGIWRLFAICVSMVVFLGTASFAHAAPRAPVALTAQDANAWLDGFFPLLLEQEQIAGATIVVVKDGQILTQRGYGFDDIASGRKVDPERTLFRIGSISKLFTWTAVMQLVERGELDLDRDVNAYLDFKIPSYKGTPITMRHLLTQSPGFEENNKYLIVQNAPNKPLAYDLDRYVKEWVPSRVYPAGKTVSYSNYGTALAGYIVARRSKMSFDDYIEKNILFPLGMARTSFRQPLPRNLVRDMSAGYSNDPREKKAFEFVASTAAGSASSTASDMSRFMIAHLQQGRFGNATILKPETAAMMHNTDVRRTKHLPGYALGFYRLDRPNLKIIGHGGDTGWFHSDLFLLQDQNVGVFVSVNSSTAKGWRLPLLNGFLDRYFPTSLTNTAFRPVAAHASQLAGIYQSNRRTVTGPLAFVTLLSQFDITVNDDGTVSGVAGVVNPGQTKWREVGDYLWQEVGGHRQFAAVVDKGKITDIQLGWVPPVLLFEKVSTAGNGSLYLFALGFAALVLLLSVVNWGARPLLRRAYGANQSAPASVVQHPLRTPLKIFALLGLLALGMIISVISLADDTIDPQSSLIDMLLVAAQLFFWTAVIGVLVAAWNLAKVIRLEQPGWWMKAKAILLLLAFFCVAWFAYSQNLLTFRLTY